MRRRRSWRGVAAMLSVLFSFVFSPATAAEETPVAPERPLWEREADALKFVFWLLKNRYLYPVDVTKCRYDILKALSGESLMTGAVSAEGKPEEFVCLDRYSYFMTPEESRRSRDQREGEYVGIGVVLEFKNNVVTVASVFEDGTAYAAGIRAGDTVRGVRDPSATEFTPITTTNEAINLLRGRSGTRVVVRFERGTGEIFERDLERRRVNTNPVVVRNEDGILYLRFGSFTLTTAFDVRDALRRARTRETHPVVIFDLRGNPGGLVLPALELLYFTSRNPDDVLLTDRDRDGSGLTYSIRFPLGACYDGGAPEPVPCSILREADGTPMIPGEFADYRFVLLVDRGTASAAEIFAGTLADWGRGSGRVVIVGETTFGKGIGQTIYRLDDDSSLQITTFEFLVGNGRTVLHGRGIAPDHYVPDGRMTAEDTVSPADAQFQVALGVARLMRENTRR